MRRSDCRRRARRGRRSVRRPRARTRRRRSEQQPDPGARSLASRGNGRGSTRPPRPRPLAPRLPRRPASPSTHRMPGSALLAAARDGDELVLGTEPRQERGLRRHRSRRRLQPSRVRPRDEKVEVAAADRRVERTLALRVQRSRPPGRSGARRQAWEVLLDDHAQLEPVGESPLPEGDRAARARCEQSTLDRVPARDEVVRGHELGQAEGEKRQTAEQGEPDTFAPPACANATVGDAPDGLPVGDPEPAGARLRSFRRPPSATSARCLDSKPPESSARSLEFQSEIIASR